MSKILMIGAVPHPGEPQTYGGARVLMQNLLDYCRQHGIGHMHLDTYRYGGRPLANALCFAAGYLRGILACRVVMFNMCRRGAFTLFRRLAPVTMALGRRVVFRAYGGSFFAQLDELPPATRLSVVRVLERCHLLLFETDALVAEAKRRMPAARVMWFPNGRQPAAQRRADGYARRFVFASQVRPEKGIDLITEAARTLPPGYTIDIYGPICEGRYARPDYFNGSGARYCGALQTEQVLPTLAQYDALLLPTSWSNEGYPGIIIEAMSLGLPVIATTIGGIPEMVTHGREGLLIEPTARDLAEAMQSMTAESRDRMGLAARARFDEQYNSDTINAHVTRALQGL